MLDVLPWLLATLSAILLIAASALWWQRGRKPQPHPLPAEWTLTARPVFNTDERRVYRQLREALPHHIVLSKLPLVRFCQPNDPQDTRYWYQLLGSINVTFAVCSANGRVLAAIDLDADRSTSRRTVQIKQAVLGACRVRYLRCPVDHLPSIPELQLLVPQGSNQTRGPQAAPTMGQPRFTGGRVRQPAAPAPCAVAGLGLLPRFLLRQRHAQRRRQQRVRRAAQRSVGARYRPPRRFDTAPLRAAGSTLTDPHATAVRVCLR
ncbi:MAG: DUF2726 domain-containing protein [Rubrivivax sp.]|nr:DUF2726 domain-containing protein [Rubrivivax sp.]